MKNKPFLISLVFLLAFPQAIYAKSIGWIADAHAGENKYRNSQSETGNTQEPKNYDRSFNSVLSELKNRKSVDLVISSGDAVNLGGDRKRAVKMVELAAKYGVRALWTKGNHEVPATMPYFGLSSENFYYYYDYENVRIIVLDNTEIYQDYQGGMSETQLDWFESVLNSTETDVIVSMHIPIFLGTDRSLVARYAEFENLVSSSGKVKLVLSGHYHENYEMEYNGVPYKNLQPLTKLGANGSYGLVSLEDYSVQYLVAAKAKYGSSSKKKKETKSKPRKVNGKIKKGVLIQTGKKFSKNNLVQIFSNKNGGAYYISATIKSNKKGVFSAASTGIKPAGKYCWYALDVKSGKKSKTSCYTVK